METASTNLFKRIIIVLLFLTAGKLNTQTIFFEGFRQTSTYMSNGSSNEKQIENNHYVIIDPNNIKDTYPSKRSMKK
jgi:hypothetical protein